MIRYSKQTDERREAGAMECWLLHGAVGLAADWRDTARGLATRGIGTRAVDLWRFLEPGPLPIREFGKVLNTDAHEEIFRGNGKALAGYSMGGRLALHALLENGHPWQAAVIVSAHAGLEDEGDRTARRKNDAGWAMKAMASPWQDFLTEWSTQPVLGGSLPRDPNLSGGLAMRRREISSSFVDWSLAAQEPLWGRLGEISVPVLWIAGEKDEKFRKLGERAAGLIPRADLAIAPGAGHRVPWEATEWFAETVAGFLKLGRA